MDPYSFWGSRANARKRRWGNLMLLQEWRREIRVKNQLTDEEYVADTHGPIMWRLLCDCGREIVIERDAFPGRRVARDCNQPGCEYAEARQRSKTPPERRMAVGRPITVDGSAHSVYMPKVVAGWVRELAKEKGLKFSNAIVQLVMDGLENSIVDSIPDGPQTIDCPMCHGAGCVPAGDGNKS